MVYQMYQQATSQKGIPLVIDINKRQYRQGFLKIFKVETDYSNKDLEADNQEISDLMSDDIGVAFKALYDKMACLDGAFNKISKKNGCFTSGYVNDKVADYICEGRVIFEGEVGFVMPNGSVISVSYYNPVMENMD